MKLFHASILFAALTALAVQAAPTNNATIGEKKAASQADHRADDKAIDAVMDKLESTFKAGDYSYTFEIMYAPVLEKMGGKEKAAEIAKTVAAQIKEQNIVMVSWKAKKPYHYVAGKIHQYALVPYDAIMTMGDKKLHQTSYEIAIKVDASKWQFVNGDNITPDVLKEFFPDFPKDIALPEVVRNYE